MAPATRSAQEEAAFMNDLFSEMDDSVWNAPPTPDPSPAKHKLAMDRNPTTPPKRKATLAVRAREASNDSKPTGPSPSKVFSASDADIASMLEGVEDIWDWDMTEVSPKKEPKTANVCLFF